MSDGNVVLLLGNGVLGKPLQVQLRMRGWHVEVRSISNGLDIADSSALRRTLLTIDPRVIINAAGCIDNDADAVTMIRANSIGPHLLASMAVCPVIHISTDCVFRESSTRIRRPEESPDPSLGYRYGETKAAGEIPDRHLVIRTSFVGPGSRMWDDVAIHARKESVYRGWWTEWSGSHVDEVADVIVKRGVADALDGRVGVVHVALPIAVAKWTVAERISRCIDLPLTIKKTSGPDGRILSPTLGYELSGDW